MHATDIVAYTYRAETLCPHCIMARFNADGRLGDDVEKVLQWHAKLRGIDIFNERTYDSGDFPKVVFADQAHHCEDCKDFEYITCDHCGEAIIND